MDKLVIQCFYHALLDESRDEGAQGNQEPKLARLYSSTNYSWQGMT